MTRWLGDGYEPGDRVRLGDPATGAYVMLSRFMDRYVVAEIFDARGLSGDQEERLKALGWDLGSSGTSPIMPTWNLGWRWYEEEGEFLAGRAESVISALRDVLAVPEERVRCRAWGDDGPFAVPYRLSHLDERPTERGAAGECTDWADLRQRLDWVLQTLPTDAAVLISGPGKPRTTVQFMTHFGNGTIATSALDPELMSAYLPEPDDDDLTERERRMLELGWRPRQQTPGLAEWTLGEPVVWADIGPLATQAVEALRALGCESPAGLEFSTFRNGSKDDPDHLGAELGLRPR
ncbi:TY-Chap domain-containing protein [Actinoallomurus sp. CA-142502]|uniref:TY-Chap domain-containing protein n=1 Tax=Actinoallomurus sp. CA-142502 TaxID=3239885 RepID=UPI003D92DE61